MTHEHSVDWLLLGFDARVINAGSNMRASVDSEIWPSIFDAMRLPKPSWIGPVQELWDHLDRLKEALKRHRVRIGRDCVIIAVAVSLSTCGEGSNLRWRHRISEIRPAGMDAAWPLMGLDVADEYLESAITALVEGQKGAEPAFLLNSFSLFETFVDAATYIKQANELHPEHSPFCVYGVWRIR